MSASDDDETDAIIASIDDISETVLYTDSKEWDAINAKSNLNTFLINKIKNEEIAKREEESQKSIEVENGEWEGFEYEGDKLFNKMINNFENMIDGDDKVKHLNIKYGYNGVIKINNDVIMEKYGDDIQKSLVPWIKNELHDGRLFDKTFWKPFRIMYINTSMLYAYKKIFKYNKYYFQLSLNSFCNRDECKYCDKYLCCCDRDITYNNYYNNYTDDSNIDFICFELALYGWKDYNSSISLLRNISRITELNYMMIEEQWNRR